MPASISIVMSTGSIARTLFMRDRLKMICEPSSLTAAPPTMLVLPPCGTIGTPCSAQRRTASATSAVVAGRSTADVRP